MSWLKYGHYRPSDVEWIDEVPVHWAMKPLKFACDLVNEKFDEFPENGRYVALENVESGTGRFLSGDVTVVPDSQTSRYSAGDVLFGKLRPYLSKAIRVLISDEAQLKPPRLLIGSPIAGFCPGTSARVAVRPPVWPSFLASAELRR